MNAGQRFMSIIISIFVLFLAAALTGAQQPPVPTNPEDAINKGLGAVFGKKKKPQPAEQPEQPAKKTIAPNQGGSPQAGVVKITAVNEGVQKTGTGFIIQLTSDTAHIVTASHVVEGDQSPKVEFFTRKDLPVPSKVVGIEGGDPKGLAVLLVKGKENIPAGLSALALGTTVSLQPGDEVTVIGCPRLAGPWSVTKANVASRTGREINLSGTVDEGNSGGPMIKDGQVVGLITGSAGAYGRATPTVSVQLFLEGYGIKPVTGNELASGGQTGGRDPLGFEPDDYLISNGPYKEGRQVVVVAKMTEPSSDQTHDEAKFFDLNRRADVWTKYFWKTRKADTNDLKVGAIVVYSCGTRDQNGACMPAKDRTVARNGWWFMDRVTDTSDVYKGAVTIGRELCSVDGIRVLVQ